MAQALSPTIVIRYCCPDTISPGWTFIGILRLSCTVPLYENVAEALEESEYPSAPQIMDESSRGPVPYSGRVNWFSVALGRTRKTAEPERPPGIVFAICPCLIEVPWSDEIVIALIVTVWLLGFAIETESEVLLSVALVMLMSGL